MTLSRNGRPMNKDFPDGVRRFIRQPNATVPAGALAEAIADSVDAGLVVEFYDGHSPDSHLLAFKVRLHGHAVRVEDRYGRHLGTFASTGAAVTHGWNSIAAPGVAREAGK